MNIEKLVTEIPIEQMTVGKIWQEFAKKVLPPGCSPIQVMEMKKSFYAGFMTAIDVPTGYSDKYSEDEICDLLRRFEKESDHFFQTT